MKQTESATEDRETQQQTTAPTKRPSSPDEEAEILDDDEVPMEPPPDLTQEAIVKQGYMKKRAQRNFQKHWNKRWFVLRKTRLSIYKDENEYKLLHIIKLRECTFKFKEKSKSNCKFYLATPSRTYHFKASSKEQRDEWVEAIRECQLESLNKHTMNLSLTTNLSMNTPPLSSPATGNVLSTPFAETHEGTEQDEGHDSDEEEFVASKEVFSDDGQIIKHGFLHKLGRRRKVWNKRWFVLRDSGRLQMYENEKEYELHKMLKLKLCSECTIATNVKRPYSFQLMSPKRRFVFAADSEEEMKSWITVLNTLLLKLHTQSPLVQPISNEDPSKTKDMPKISV